MSSLRTSSDRISYHIHTLKFPEMGDLDDVGLSTFFSSMKKNKGGWFMSIFSTHKTHLTYVPPGLYTSLRVRPSESWTVVVPPLKVEKRSTNGLTHDFSVVGSLWLSESFVRGFFWTREIGPFPVRPFEIFY